MIINHLKCYRGYKSGIWPGTCLQGEKVGKADNIGYPGSAKGEASIGYNAQEIFISEMVWNGLCNMVGLG